MEKQTGREHREVGSFALFHKVVAGSCMGVLCGVLLTFIAEKPAHAEFLEVRQPGNVSDLLGMRHDAQSAPVEEDDPTDVMSREELVMHASLADDYRFRIPAWSKPQRKIQTLSVTATAYNNVREQTDDTPDIAAWGDRIQPGMPLIAVSRDLVKMGLKRGTRVRVSGMDGEFVVLDKMNKRFKRRIDIYMGKDIRAARRFGRRNLVITWVDGDLVETATLVASR